LVPPDKIVFLSKGRWNEASNIGGVLGRDAADALCELEGHENNMNVGRVFVSWLSMTGSSAISRLMGGRWRLPDKRIVFSEQLKIQSGPDIPINMHADGTVFTPDGGDPDEEALWTGTFANGTGTGVDCNGWTSQLGPGTSGVVGTDDPVKWTDNGVRACDVAYAILCFQQ
jgi:hypothetical protein